MPKTASSTLKKQISIQHPFTNNSSILLEFFKKKHHLLQDDAGHLIHYFSSAFAEASSSLRRPNVLLLGITGSGKSSLVNAIFASNIAEVGCGATVTQHFTKYSSPDTPLVIYDSKGIRLMNEEFITETEQFFAHHERSKAIHVIWYVINAAKARFETFDEQLCKRLSTKAPILVLLNKADLCNPEDLLTLRKCVENINLHNFVGVFETVATKNPTRDIQNCPSCGSEDVVIKKLIATATCSNCGAKIDLKVDAGLKTVIKETEKALPVAVREAFIASQRVSLQLKLESAVGILKEFYLDFEKFWGTTKLIKIIAKMMARLAIVWEFKHIKDKFSELAKRLVDQLPKKTHQYHASSDAQMQVQRIQTTVLGIVWNRCLSQMTRELLMRTVDRGMSLDEMDKKWKTILEKIEKNAFRQNSIQFIVDGLVDPSVGIQKVLDQEKAMLN
eukprot:TRINITY_DN4799_c0_g1_i1.p1 TRINITY_DN4799_c0_g1~~TRINITY_DN4799_c0_g1_i1.p1  ORF type:complete len:488 (-),score=83.31 TRINITY_DN4799_c0_g1_i1:27-1364(-)